LYGIVYDEVTFKEFIFILYMMKYYLKHIHFIPLISDLSENELAGFLRLPLLAFLMHSTELGTDKVGG
jgi:hypothetical protein